VSNLTIHQTLSNLDEQAAKLDIQKSLVLKEALQSTDVDAIFKAQQYLVGGNPKNSLFQAQQRQGQPGEHKSLIFDPFETNTSQGFFQKNGTVSFELLRRMSETPIINAIITTRKDQVTEFCTPQADKYSKGFVIKRKGVDKEYQPTDADKKAIDALTEFLMNCADDEEIHDLDDFDAFIRKLIDDSLSMDQGCFEVVHNKLREPVQFLAVDGATVRLADSFDNVNNTQRGEEVDGYFPSYVQIYQNRIFQEYYPWEMCMGVRNPQTKLSANGYGKSELEVLIQMVTSMLNSDSYNSKFFQNGTAPKGALLVKNTGGLNKDKIAELRRDWTSTMSGVNNFHKTPVLDAEKIEWLDLQKSNRDMEFSKYQEYLIKVACAVYKISPEEIGFPLQGSQGSGMGSKEGGKQEKEYSLDKGLKPLLKSLQTWINKFIIGPKSENKYEFQFAGIDTEDSKSEEERLTKAVTTYMTVDEVRAVRDLEPLPNGQGKIILSPIMVQQQQMKQQQDMMKQQQQQEMGNDNPFEQPDEQDNNPFAKALVSWWDKEIGAFNHN
jgi:portal protein